MSQAILPTEIEIFGKWIIKNNSIQADSNCERIEYLINNLLKFIKNDNSGWDSLYLDPKDQRYWELIYPDSDLHGGGAPVLRCLSYNEVIKKYGSNVSVS